MNLEVKLLKSINEVDEKTWNSIVGEDRILCSHQYLRAVEEANINVCFYRYPMVYADGELVAHTCTYFMYFELDIFAKGMIKQMITFIRKFWPSFLKLKLFECGTPVALGNLISYKEGVNKKAILKLIVATMEKVARESGIKILLLRDFVDEEIVFYDLLKKWHFGELKNLPNLILNK